MALARRKAVVYEQPGGLVMMSVALAGLDRVALEPDAWLTAHHSTNCSTILQLSVLEACVIYSYIDIFAFGRRFY